MENVIPGPTHSSKMSGFQMPKVSAPVEKELDFKELPVEEVVDRGHDEDQRGEAESKVLTFEELARDKTPQEIKDIASTMTYEDRVKAFELSMDEAMSIVDILVTKGEYQEVVNLSRTMSVVIGTRSTRFNSYLSKVIDSESPRKTGRLNQLMTEYQLAGSLVSFGKEELPSLYDQNMTEDEWVEVVDARVGFIKQLQGPIFLTLCNKLARFDSKMMIVFSEGYDENF